MKQSILLTGGSGLLSLNFALVGQDRYNIILGLNKKIISIRNITSIKLNLNSISKIRSEILKLNPKIIIHNAGLTSVEECESNPSLAFHINSQLTTFIADICKDLDILLIYISTDHLFDGKNSFSIENQQLNPINNYAKSKAIAEKYVMDVCKKIIIARTNFFGWGPNYRSSFSDKIIYSLRKKEKIFLFEDVFFTPILTSVLFECLIELVNKKKYGIFNIVSKERFTKYDFGVMLSKVFKLDQNLILKNKLSCSKNLTKRPYDMSLSNKKIVSNLTYRIPNIIEQMKILKQQEKQRSFKEIINLC